MRGHPCWFETLDVGLLVPGLMSRSGGDERESVRREMMHRCRGWTGASSFVRGFRMPVFHFLLSNLHDFCLQKRANLRLGGDKPATLYTGYYDYETLLWLSIAPTLWEWR